MREESRLDHTAVSIPILRGWGDKVVPVILPMASVGAAGAMVSLLLGAWAALAVSLLVMTLGLRLHALVSRAESWLPQRAELRFYPGRIDAKIGRWSATVQPTGDHEITIHTDPYTQRTRLCIAPPGQAAKVMRVALELGDEKRLWQLIDQATRGARARQGKGDREVPAALREVTQKP